MAAYSYFSFLYIFPKTYFRVKRVMIYMPSNLFNSIIFSCLIYSCSYAAKRQWTCLHVMALSMIFVYKNQGKAVYAWTFRYTKQRTRQNGKQLLLFVSRNRFIIKNIKKGPALSLSRITLPSIKQKIKTLVMLYILPLSETILYLFEG